MNTVAYYCQGRCWDGIRLRRCPKHFDWKSSNRFTRQVTASYLLALWVLAKLRPLFFVFWPAALRRSFRPWRNSVMIVMRTWRCGGNWRWLEKISELARKKSFHLGVSVCLGMLLPIAVACVEKQFAPKAQTLALAAPRGGLGMAEDVPSSQGVRTSVLLAVSDLNKCCSVRPVQFCSYIFLIRWLP